MGFVKKDWKFTEKMPQVWLVVWHPWGFFFFKIYSYCWELLIAKNVKDKCSDDEASMITWSQTSSCVIQSTFQTMKASVWWTALAKGVHTHPAMVVYVEMQTWVTRVQNTKVLVHHRTIKQGANSRLVLDSLSILMIFWELNPLDEVLKITWLGWR